MKCLLDKSKEYAVVLEGGGARGAYHVGVVRALLEEGIRIKAISGVSVGALNGAMFCAGDIARAQSIWEEISYSTVIEVNDEIMERLSQRDFRRVSFKQVAKEGMGIIRGKGFGIGPLKTLIRENVDEEKVRQSDIDLYITTFSVTDDKLLVVKAKELLDGELKDMLLASSYLPVFQKEELGGKTYLDGGKMDSVPVNILIEEGYQDIIIVRVYGIGHPKEIPLPDHINSITIGPRVNLGGVLEFKRGKSRRNLLLGYYDAKRALYGLKGRYYYVKEQVHFNARPQTDQLNARLQTDQFNARPKTDEYRRPQIISAGNEKEGFAKDITYLKKLCEAALPVLDLLCEEYLTKKPEFITSKTGARKNRPSVRALTEVIFPSVAKILRLNSSFQYEELYYALLEEGARQAKLSRFHIYQLDQLIEMVKPGLVTLQETKVLPAYLTVLAHYSSV